MQVHNMVLSLPYSIVLPVSQKISIFIIHLTQPCDALAPFGLLGGIIIKPGSNALDRSLDTVSSFIHQIGFSRSAVLFGNNAVGNRRCQTM